MSSERYAICKHVAEDDVMILYRFQVAISPDQAALGALSQEEVDAVVCLRAGTYLNVFETGGTWYADNGTPAGQVWAKTRALALHALAVKLEPEVPA